MWTPQSLSDVYSCCQGSNKLQASSVSLREHRITLRLTPHENQALPTYAQVSQDEGFPQAVSIMSFLIRTGMKSLIRRSRWSKCSSARLESISLPCCRECTCSASRTLLIRTQTPLTDMATIESECSFASSGQGSVRRRNIKVVVPCCGGTTNGRVQTRTCQVKQHLVYHS